MGKAGKEALSHSIPWKLRLLKTLVFLRVTEDNCGRVKKLSLDLVPVCASSHGSPVSSTPDLYFSCPFFLSFLAKPKCHKLPQI